jgi:hypothetical protein
MYKFIVLVRSKLLVFLTHSLALPILQIIRKPEVFPYSKKELQNFPTGTLGNDLVNFVEEKNIQLLPYYARHDIKHILLQYDTTDNGEVCLQCFMLGNGHVSFPVIATVIYGYITMPEFWSNFKAAYKRGKGCNPISDWAWFDILEVPTSLLKQRLNQSENYNHFLNK